MTRVYVSGPMSGMPDFNYPAFFKAAQQLEDAGFEPINPARTEGREGCTTWLDFMRPCLRDLADADAVATLPGWENSSGASLEVDIARRLNLPVEPLEEWLTDGDA